MNLLAFTYFPMPIIMGGGGKFRFFGYVSIDEKDLDE